MPAEGEKIVRSILLKRKLGPSEIIIPEYVMERMIIYLKNFYFQEMECCFRPHKKNRPPTKKYKPYQAEAIVMETPTSPNDMFAINQSIESREKMQKLSKLNITTPQEKIPFPPRTVQVNIGI